MSNPSPDGGGAGAMKWIVTAAGGVVALVVGGLLAIVIVVGVIVAAMSNAGGGASSILALDSSGTKLLTGNSCTADTALNQGASGGGGGSTIGSLSADQLDNARTIIGVAKSAFATDALQKQAAIVAIMTAMQESTLHNLDHGDNAINPDGSVADSVGLFQQQHFWGTREQRMNPAWSSGKFYQHLANVPGWMNLAPGVAAQKVQISKYPDAYNKWQDLAKSLIDANFALVQAIDVPASVGGVGGAPGTGTDPGDVVNVGCPSGGTNNGEIGNPLNPGSYNITAGFGPRKAPCATCSSQHMGIDMAGQCGTPVFAATDGTISVAGAPRGTGSGYGNVIFETVGSRTFIYGHLNINDPFKVKEGDKVKLGQQIGVMGNTGDSTGCHLHFEIRDNNTPTDPMAIYEAAGVKL